MSAADGLPRKEEDAGASPATLTTSECRRLKAECRITLRPPSFTSFSLLPSFRMVGRAVMPRSRKPSEPPGCVGAIPTPSANLNPQPQENPMTLAQYVPQWLRLRFQKPAPQNAEPINK